MTRTRLPITPAVVLLATLAGIASADVVLLTENFTGAVGTQPPGFVTDTAVGPGDTVFSRNDGSGEYEHRFTAGTGGDVRALGYYNNPDDTDRGVWRDVSISTNTRFSGGADNQNGLVFRASDNALADGGDYYHVRVSGSDLQLYRNNGGAFTLLSSTSAGASIAAITNRLMTVDVKNIANPDTDHVQIVARLYAGSTVGSGVVREINLIDDDANAITRAGGAGYRSYFGGGATPTVRSTFDNLSVTGTNERLLWYDDYYDNTAPRMEGYVTGGNILVDNTKYTIRDLGSGAQANAAIDFDAQTSTGAWTNVRVEALMRWNTQADGGRLEAGITARETGVSSSSDGSYYFFGLIRNEDSTGFAARIFRVVDGVQTMIGDQFFGGTDVMPESENIFLQLNVTEAAGGVYLAAIASLNADYSDPFAMLDATDLSPFALMGPGSVGYRVAASGGVSAAIVNFDNLTVTMIPAPVALPAGLALLGFVAVRRRPVSR